jgi:1-acyl-sn-glycerol-3-phosphate acyltransferase
VSSIRVSSRIITPIIKAALSILCRIEADAMRQVPRTGPLIIITNHVNFLEVPIIYTRLFPRDAVGLAKRETWDNPLLGALANVWGAIPIDRGATDLQAMRLALDALRDGRILVLAPEGTRSIDGCLRRGHGGVVQLALRSGAPILPVAHVGGERFWNNLKHLRRTGFSLRVGQPFVVERPNAGPVDASASVGREMRTQMADAVMNRLALLLPPERRGVYAGAQDGPTRFIRLL